MRLSFLSVVVQGIKGGRRRRPTPSPFLSDGRNRATAHRHQPLPAVADHGLVLRVSSASFLAFSCSPSLPLPPPNHRTSSLAIVRHRVPPPGARPGHSVRPTEGRTLRANARPGLRSGPATRPEASGTAPAWPRSGPALRPATSAIGPACKPAWADVEAGPNSKNSFCLKIK